MKLYERAGDDEIHRIMQLFPDLDRFVFDPSSTSYEKVAISVFDGWLGPDRLHMLDCDSRERAKRNQKLLSHWQKIFERTSVLAVHLRGKAKQRLLIRRFASQASFLKLADYHPYKPSSRFQLIALPDLEALYMENWDDTNVLWFKSMEKARPVIEWAAECGLHQIAYDG